ncbi:hypothetical protein BH20ACT22_BH20ACT22_14780 [soil metagenome]
MPNRLTHHVTVEQSYETIDTLLEDPAAELVDAFYRRDGAHDLSPRTDFVGELFTSLGEADPNAFEPVDLLAVHLMGMRFTVTATETLLNSKKERDEVCDLLSEIPCNVDIWDANADLSDSSAASRLWQRLVGFENGYDGIGWVTAGKLLARKRPRLIPVIDNVIVTLVPGTTDGYWALLQGYLRSEERRRKVDSLRHGKIPSFLTPTLRLLDTAIWMRGSNGPAKAIREKFDLPD